MAVVRRVRGRDEGNEGVGLVRSESTGRAHPLPAERPRSHMTATASVIAILPWPSDDQPDQGPSLEADGATDEAAAPDEAAAIAIEWQPYGAVLKARALLLWPGLDRARLTATGGDPLRIARLVERRTPLSIETILAMLGVRGVLPARPAPRPRR